MSAFQNNRDWCSLLSSSSNCPQTQVMANLNEKKVYVNWNEQLSRSGTPSFIKFTCIFNQVHLQTACGAVLFNVVEAHGYGFRSTVVSGEHSRSKTSAIIAMYDVSTTRVVVRYKTVLFAWKSPDHSILVPIWKKSLWETVQVGLCSQNPRSIINSYKCYNIVQW